MQKISEELWTMYKLGKGCAANGEKKALTEKTVSLRRRLTERMTAEQAGLFFEYEECAGKKNIICEKESFYAGIHFAISFLAEALKGT